MTNTSSVVFSHDRVFTRLATHHDITMSDHQWPHPFDICVPLSTTLMSSSLSHPQLSATATDRCLEGLSVGTCAAAPLETQHLARGTSRSWYEAPPGVCPERLPGDVARPACNEDAAYEAFIASLDINPDEECDLSSITPSFMQEQCNIAVRVLLCGTNQASEHLPAWTILRNTYTRTRRPGS